jgi:hypothetical protein
MGYPRLDTAIPELLYLGATAPKSARPQGVADLAQLPKRYT